MDNNGNIPMEDIQLNQAGGEDGCEHPRWSEEEQALRKVEDIADEMRDKDLMWDIGKIKCVYETFSIESENHM